jgi:2,3-bisphosphoglycerate-independent phosphoglycerate mutase
VNKARVSAGKRPANMAWVWGQGTKPAMPAFFDKYGQRGAMITAVDLLAGIAQLIGWDRLDVPGVTSYHDTSYVNQGKYTCEALDKYDVVCCHVEAPDEASHQGDWKTKVAAIEEIDKHVVGPVLKKLQSFGDAEKDPKAQGWRIMVLPDHYTLVSTRKHDDTPVPIAMAGAFVHAHRTGTYCEEEANASDLFIANGYELMEFFLHGGRARVK